MPNYRRMKSCESLPSGRRKMADYPRLIEREFPVETVSRAGKREKSVRQGHLSTLQMWWARRPQSVCRAVLFAALAPTSATVEEHADVALELQRYSNLESIDASLLKLTADLSEARVDSAAGEQMLQLASALLAVGRERPAVVVDSFAGGGSIPVEALRLGLETHASDLSPVATAALRLAVEEAPRRGPSLVGEYLVLVEDLHNRLLGLLGGIYAADGYGIPSAFFWCRTFPCGECGILVPLIKDVDLEKGANRAFVAFEPDASAGVFRFSVHSIEGERSGSTPTVGRTGATCPRCSAVATFASLRALAKEGKLGDQMYAIADQTVDGRRYRIPTSEDLKRAQMAGALAADIREGGELSDMPLDRNGIRHLWAMQYGISTVTDLFSDRQLVALCTVQRLMIDSIRRLRAEEGESSRALSILLALTLNRLVMYGSRHTWWQSNGAFPANMFGRQAIPMIWNYVEIPVLSERASGLASAAGWIERAVGQLSHLPGSGDVRCSDAASLKFEDKTVDLVMVDPPYFDSITYSYLADVFYAWMRPLLAGILTEFDPWIPSRSEEAIVDRPHAEAVLSKDDAHFFAKMREAFSEASRVLKDDGRLVVMFGHKTTHAWAVFLRSLAAAGFRPVSSWPIEAERKGKFGSYRLDSLSTACVITCVRADVPVGEPVDWPLFEAGLLVELRKSIEGLRDADRYGTELSTALLAPAVGLFCMNRVIDEQGDILTMETFLDRLPDVLTDLVRLEAVESLERLGLADVAEVLSGLPSSGQNNSVSWRSYPWTQEVPALAIALVEKGWRDSEDLALPLPLLQSACQFLHAAAAFSVPGSKEEQAALVGVSTLSSALRRRAA
jgi:adenine-specific DNA methylase